MSDRITNKKAVPRAGTATYLPQNLVPVKIVTGLLLVLQHHQIRRDGNLLDQRRVMSKLSTQNQN